MRASIVVVSVLLISCIVPAALNQSTVTGAVRQQATRHRVGMLVPLSGPLAEYGHAVRNGVALARRENPREFEDIEFVFDDTRYDPKTALGSFSRLVGRGDISLIFNWGTATSEALAPIAERRRVALVANSQSSSLSEGKQHVIRFINPAQDFSLAILNALRRKGYRRLAVVKAELGYINELLDGIRANLIEGESLHIVDSVLPDERDFKPTMVNLSAHTFDALGVFLVSGQIGQFYRQLQASGLHAPTFGSDFFESRDEIARAGLAIEGALFSNILVQSDFAERHHPSGAGQTLGQFAP